MNIKIGSGYDVHRYVENRKLILGGIEIPFQLGLLGHSDADVLLHAISDALLGALALGDIGKLFPDTDEKFKGADSMVLLKEVYEIVKKENFVLGNLDATIRCEKPKLRPYIDTIRENIAKNLNVGIDQVSVKATTEEGLGFTGEMKGIACEAIVLILKKDSM